MTENITPPDRNANHVKPLRELR